MKIKLFTTISLLFFLPAVIFADVWFPTGSPTDLTPVVPTWGIKVPGIPGGAGCLQRDSAGIVTSIGSNCGTSSLGYPFPLAGNATSTLTQFNGGITAYATSTIGDTTQAGGLTISGGATTTGNAYFGLGVNLTDTLNHSSDCKFAGTLCLTNTPGPSNPMMTINDLDTGGRSYDIVATDNNNAAAQGNLEFRLNGGSSLNPPLAIDGGNQRVGIASSSPWKLLSVGNSNTGTFALSTSSAGCAQFSPMGELFSRGTNCGTGNGTVTSITAGTGLTGGTITTSGTIALSIPVSLANGGTATSTFYNGGVVFSDGTKITQASNSGNGVLFWDNTNKRFSVGTTTPYTPFQVWGPDTTAGTRAFQVVNNASTTEFFVDDSGLATLNNTLTVNGNVNLSNGGAITTTDNGNEVIGANWGWYLQGDNTHIVQIANTSEMIGFPIGFPAGATFPTNALLVNGRIGIGTTTPWASLSVVGTTNDTNLGNTLPLFIIASSTPTATTTTFIVNRNGSVGVGTSTPFGTFSVVGSSSPPFVVSTSTSNGSQGPVFEVAANGHQLTGGLPPSCGTGCSSVAGDDENFRATTGVGVTAVTINFAATWKNVSGASITPVCTSSDESGGTTVSDASSTPTSVTMNLSASLTTKMLAVRCTASNNFTF